MNRLPQIAFERGYRAHPDGSVTNPRGKLLKCSIKWDQGYRVISFALGLPPLKVSRLVAFQKFGEQIFQPGIQVRHLDGNPANDTAENIAIGTQFQNSMDVPLAARRQNVANAITANRKYDPLDVCNFYEQTLSYKLTMERFGVKSATTIYALLKNAGMGIRRHPRKMTFESVKELRFLRASGWKLKHLSSKFEISMGAASEIINHKKWKNQGNPTEAA